MLRLPAALLEDISLRSGDVGGLAQTCKQLHRALNEPQTQLRLYLAIASRRRHRRSSSAGSTTSSSSSSSRHSSGSGRGSTPGGDAAQQHDQDDAQPQLLPAAPLEAVYGLLSCRPQAATADSSLRLLQLVLQCARMLHLLPAPQQDAAQHMLASTSASDISAAAGLLLAALPGSQHCLLPFCAAGGHLHLVRALQPACQAPVRLHASLHYVRTSAFLAAAAAGQAQVLAEQLAAGAVTWACQLPGVSLTATALDLAARGGHLPAMQLLGRHVRNPGPHFLTAAADSGSGAAMQWALSHFFSMFSAVTAFTRAHIVQLQDALRVAAAQGHLSALRQVVAALHKSGSQDCCVLALSCASTTSNSAAMRCVLESPQLPQQLARGGPKLLSKLAQVVASCMRQAIRLHDDAAMQLLLDGLTAVQPGSPLAPARPLLGGQMPSVFDQAASAGNSRALQLLLLRLPEHYEALGVSALEAALTEGHAESAALVKTLLLMQGTDPVALSAEGRGSLARASLHGALKAACARGDAPGVASLLAGAPDDSGPDDNTQLLLLRTAAGAGQEGVVRLCLQEFGGGPARLDLNLRAVCRGAVAAGQLALLQSLAADTPSQLLVHISTADAMSEYLRAALLCGQVDLAAWLVAVAAASHQLGVVRGLLHSLLATSRWELDNAGSSRCSSVHEAVLDLLMCLADHAGAGAGTAAADTAASASASAAPAAGAPDAHAVGAADAAAGDAASASVHQAAAPGPPVSSGAAPCVLGLQLPPGCKLGEQLLTPRVLALLLHTAEGSPQVLLCIVSMVQRFGLEPGSKQQPAQAAMQQELRAESPSQPPAQAQQAPPASPGAPAPKMPSGSGGSSGSSSTAVPAPVRSGSAASSSRSSFTLPSSSSSSSDGDASPSARAATAEASSSPEDSRGGWAPAWLLGQQAQRPAAADSSPPQHVVQPPPAAAAPERQGSNSLQQLTGQVASLHMSSPVRSRAQQHTQAQLASQQQQQQHAQQAQRPRRESNPCSPRGAAASPRAAAVLRPAVSLPLPRPNHQPVHPYMSQAQYQQLRQLQEQQQQQQRQAAGGAQGAAAQAQPQAAPLLPAAAG